MNYLYFFIFFILIHACNGPKKSYWCGDHPCANKAEQQLFFKYNLSVEIKQKYIQKKKEISNVDKIVTQTSKLNKKDKRKITKLEKVERKKILKEKRELIKLSKIQNKKNSKWKKNKIVKKKIPKRTNANIKKKNKKKKKKKKKISKSTNTNIKKKTNKIDLKDNIADNTDFKDVVLNSDFQKIAEIIENRNKLKAYPNIDDIPK